MASLSKAKSRRSAFDSRARSLPLGCYPYHSSSSAFASSSSKFSARSSTFLARSSSSKRVTVYGQSSLSSSVRFQIDQRSTSPGRSISVQKKSNNAVSSNQKKTCMCSPTTHPGSFRCSLHKNSRYSVGANHRQFQNGIKSSYGSSNTLNFRRSAMTNSLVRIGGVEGGNLVKRSLSALIRPSSHQQRRRTAFQPRPSRLSVMSRAEDCEILPTIAEFSESNSFISN